MTIAFCISGTPTGKGRPRFNAATGRTYTPERTRSYEDWVRSCCMENCSGAFFPAGTAIKAELFAFFPVPVSDSRIKKRNKLLAVLKPTKKPDGDNLAKIICDALNEIAYQDDSQITHLTVVKRFGARAFVQVYLSEDSETFE